MASTCNASPSEVNQHMVIQHVEHLEAQIFLKDIYCGK